MNRMVYKKKQKKFHLFRVLFVLALISGGTFCGYYYAKNGNLKFNFNFDFDVIKQKIAMIGATESTLSSEYTIAGQTKVVDMDGYTTIFTTLNENHEKTYIEYKQNQGSWSESSYWGGTMTENGCGITALSIIASGYGKDYTPNDFREKYYPHLDTTKIQTELKSMGIKCTDFYFDKSYISKTYIENWLKTNRPVLICVDGTKENIWTQSSHYMVLLDCDEKNQVYLSNPNGEDGTEKSSGWYDLNEILPYVVKALFIESY